MAKSRSKKGGWVLVLLLLAGIVLGSFLSELAAGVKWLSWLNYGMNFGITEPLKLDLGVLVLQFALSIKITIGSIVGMIIGIIIYRLI